MKATGVNTSKFARKVGSTIFKINIKIAIKRQLIQLPWVKKTDYDIQIKRTEDKITSIDGLVTTVALNTKTKKIVDEIQMSLMNQQK